MTWAGSELSAVHPHVLQEEFVELRDSLFEAFFTDKHVTRTMSILIHENKTKIEDCISTVLTCMCTEPMHLIFDESSFCPFQSQPLLCIPYDHMTRAQLSLIKSFLVHCSRSKHFVACSHMGVGTRVFSSNTTNMKKFVDTSNVLFALYKLIHNSSKTKKQKIDVYNVMTQRLFKSANISPEAIIKARALCAEYQQTEK